jgi:hypothetical protein
MVTMLPEGSHPQLLTVQQQQETAAPQLEETIPVRLEAKQNPQDIQA